MNTLTLEKKENTFANSDYIIFKRKPIERATEAFIHSNQVIQNVQQKVPVALGLATTDTHHI